MQADSGSAGPGKTRRLAAIMFTDIVGFSRTMGADEARMLRLLDVHNQLIQQAVAAHHGHVIKTIGDAFLVDFSSVVHAVQCAQRIQAQLRTYNAEQEATEQIHVRIGIHSGDIVQREGDVFGDGVNVASRLQAFAAPDTICISHVVYREVAKKLPLGTVISLGRPHLKNIAQREPVYALLSDAPQGFRQRLHVQQLKLKHWRWTLQVAAAVLALLWGGVVTYRLLFPPAGQSPVIAPIGSQPALPLPEKPSLVVLPFVNMSGDPEQEHFSDGLTEDLTSDLAQLSSLFVISRNSAFTYKGQAVKLPAVSRELGVRYVVEGSVRKAGDQVRVTAQLVDATQDQHLWSGRYDRLLTEFFTLQDEIRQKILFALKVKLLPEEQAYFHLSRAKNLDAYELLWRARQVGFRYTKEGLAQARHLCEQALALDPQFAAAYVCLSSWYMAEWMLFGQDPQTLEQALTRAQQAIALDDTLPPAHAALGDAYKMKGQLELAITAGQKSVTLGPNCSLCYGELAEHLLCAQRPPEEILPLVEKALRLEPLHYRPDYHTDLAGIYRQMGRHDEAITQLKQVLLHNPTFGVARRDLVLNYADLGWDEEAKREMVEILKLLGPLTLEQVIAANRKRWAVCIERNLAAYERDVTTFRRLAAAIEKNK